MFVFIFGCGRMVLRRTTAHYAYCGGLQAKHTIQIPHAENKVRQNIFTHW